MRVLGLAPRHLAEHQQEKYLITPGNLPANATERTFSKFNKPPWIANHQRKAILNISHN
jgi:hypothetical protein